MPDSPVFTAGNTMSLIAVLFALTHHEFTPLECQLMHNFTHRKFTGLHWKSATLSKSTKRLLTQVDKVARSR